MLRNLDGWPDCVLGKQYALLMERAGAKIHIVIDINLAKQGKYLTATGLQIRPSQKPCARRLPALTCL
jgi:hypothetical protein